VPELEYFLVAESVSVDRESGLLSIWHTLDAITAAGVPFGLPSAVAVSVWRLGADDMNSDHQVDVRLLGPRGSCEGPLRVNFTPTTQRHRVFHRFRGLQLDEEGPWTFELRLDGGEAMARHVLLLTDGSPG